MTTLVTQILVRRGTAAEWADSTNVIAEGEWALATDTNELRMGTGALWVDTPSITLDSPVLNGIPTVNGVPLLSNIDGGTSGSSNAYTLDGGSSTTTAEPSVGYGVRIQDRRDTAANWTSANPILAAGEPGFETDTGKLKIGNGTSNWTALAYISSGGGGGGAVSSVFGRTGAVTAETGDYTAAEVGADPAGSASTAQSNAETFATSAAATAQSNAETYAASQASTAQSNAETYAAAQASTAQSNAETYTNTEIASEVTRANAAYDAAGSASTAQTNAESYADTNKLAKSANLSDVASASTARTNLGLGTAATQASTAFDAAGAAASAQTTAEAYADTNKLAKSANLSDVASAGTARTNLGLGTLATQNGTFSGTSSGTNTGDQTLSGLGGMAQLVPTLPAKTSAYNAAVDDFVLADTTSSSFTVTLPTTPADKSLIAYKVVGGTMSGGSLQYYGVIAAGGSAAFNTVGGSTTLTAKLLRQGYLLQYNAADNIWIVVLDSLDLGELDLRYDAIGAASTAQSNAETYAASQASTAQSNAETYAASQASAAQGASLQKTSNLSDLASASTARTNLGLGSLATQSGTFSGTSSGTNTGDQTIPTSLPPNGAAGGDLSGTYPSPTLAAVATAGTTGAANDSLQITIDAKGRVTSVSAMSIAIAASQVTSGQFAMSLLASGTPTGSKFIRDDGTLQVPPGATANVVFYGDGSDGAATLSSNTTLARDMFYTNLTVNTGVVVSTAGYRIFVNGTLTNNGTIRNNGSTATTATGVGGGTGATYGQGGKGGATSTTGVGANGTAVTYSYGGAGGAGGSGSSGAGGSGGTFTAPPASTGNLHSLPYSLLGCVYGYQGSAISLTGASGGAGGGSGSGNSTLSVTGGGGGGGGGGVYVGAYIITGTGTIQANGGGGAAGVGSGTGGGGGGGGGWVVVYSTSASGGAVSGQTIQALGGAYGAGNGTGVNGVAGSNGTVVVEAA